MKKKYGCKRGLAMTYSTETPMPKKSTWETLRGVHSAALRILSPESKEELHK